MSQRTYTVTVPATLTLKVQVDEDGAAKVVDGAYQMAADDVDIKARVERDWRDWTSLDSTEATDALWYALMDAARGVREGGLEL